MNFLLVWSTVSCMVDSIAAHVIQLVLAWSFLESNDDKAIRKDLVALKKEMNSISMVDEFARYAKLQRKYNKLDDEAKAKMNACCASRIKLKLVLTYGVRLVNGILTSILMFLYRNEAVVVFPTGTLWPLEPLLSFPAKEDSCISLPVWILMMRLSVTCFSGGS